VDSQYAPCIATFTNTTTNAVSYSWNFGDGSTSTEAAPSHVYATQGQYTITLEGKNAEGKTSSANMTITVQKADLLLPVVNFSFSGNTEFAPCNVGFYSTTVNATSYSWILPSGAEGTSTTNTISVTYGTNAVSGNLSVKGINPCGESGTAIRMITVNREVQAKLFLEGLYNSASQLMNKARNENGNYFADDIADKTDLEIRSSVSPYPVIISFSGLNLKTNGMCLFSAPSELTGTYFLVIRHRNHLETWSALPVSFMVANPIFDFTDQQTKAFGNNLKLSGSIYTLYSGDVNHDGVVDGLDMIQIDNRAMLFSPGYLNEDLNGDGNVDSLDMILLEGNSSAFTGVKMP
jgi:PKD repeat protein